MVCLLLHCLLWLAASLMEALCPSRIPPSRSRPLKKSCRRNAFADRKWKDRLKAQLKTRLPVAPSRGRLPPQPVLCHQSRYYPPLLHLPESPLGSAFLSNPKQPNLLSAHLLWTHQPELGQPWSPAHCSTALLNSLTLTACLHSHLAG